MIYSLGNALAESLFYDRESKATRRFPSELKRAARRKILYIYDADELEDLKIPPDNRLEKLKGRWRDYYSIRINDKWRVVFGWKDNGAYDVQVVDYH